MKKLERIFYIVIGMVVLSHCKFPPPTTSDQQTQQPSPQEYQIKTQQIEEANKDAAIDALQEELDQLRGKFEVVSYEVEQLRDQSKIFTKDFDARLAVIENQGIGTSNRPSTADIARSVSISKTTQASNIDTWIDNVKNKTNIPQAITGITQWVEQAPNSVKKQQAVFALAKAHFIQNDYPRAIQGFQTVVDDYPTSNEACDARYYQGMSFVKLGDGKNATLFFQETIEICPKHTAKSKAEYQISKISQN